MTDTLLHTGVLILHKNRTYSAHVPPPSHGKLFYRCIPRTQCDYDILIPYRIPHIKNRLTTVHENLYIVFRIPTCPPLSEPLVATLQDVIGPVSRYDAFQTYELISRGLYTSIQSHTLYIRDHLPQVVETGFANMPQGECMPITIDGPDTLDRDDALSIQHTDHTYEISVHISCVAAWLDALDSWSYICDDTTFRAATIYLPHETRPLFPPVLSHHHMSLQADGQPRPVLTTTFIYDAHTHQRIDTRIHTQRVTIQRNHIYESPECMNDPLCRDLIETTSHLLHERTEPLTTHTVVEYWMKETGRACGDALKRRGSLALYRECCDVGSDTTTPIESQWKSYISRYTLGGETDVYHCGFDGMNYVHITSPIRRWVDIWNQSLFLHDVPPECAYRFICERGGIERIHTYMAHIRKTERLCRLVSVMSTHMTLSTQGILYYDESVSTWRIYVPEYTSWHRVHGVTYDRTMSGQRVPCTLVSFEHEHSIRKKIRVLVHV